MGKDTRTVVEDLLRRASEGEADAEEEFLRILLPDLRRIARSHLRGQSGGHTLQTTALVHEAWMRLHRSEGRRAGDRTHFLSLASRAMRSVLVDHARRKRARKRGRGAARVPLDELLVAFEDRGVRMVDLDDALRALDAVDPEAGRVVELRFFGGLTVREAASALRIPLRRAERDWEFARAWLHETLS